MYKVTAEYSLGRKVEFVTPNYFIEGEAIWNTDFKESGVVTKVEDQKLLTGDVAPEVNSKTFPSLTSLEKWRDKMLKNLLTLEDHNFLKGMNVRWE